MDGVLGSVQSVCGDYIDKCRLLDVERKPGDGLLGMGSGADSDPCHDAFYTQMEALSRRTAESGVSSSEARSVLEYVYALAPENEDLPLAYWMLLAVHGAVLHLISCLTSTDAAQLLEEYQKWYPRFKRLPTQKKTIAALREQALRK